jgi:arylsulfatase A-like enzyme
MKTTVRLIAFVVIASLFIATAARAANASKPNIVLIVSDDQGYADGGCFGDKVIKTPRLDKLATEGVRLTDYYVSWPACTPSRGSILTGRFPQRSGLYDMIRNEAPDYGYKYPPEEYAVSAERVLGMDVREITIGQVLKKAGYATGVFGKWDGGSLKRFLPLQRGFDRFFGFPNTGIDYFTHERYGVPCLYRDNEQIKVEGYSTELFKQEALRFIDDNKDRPFFLYVPFNAPHGASNFAKDVAQAPADYVAKTYPDLKAKDKKTIYMSCISYMDDCIGQIVDRLGQDGLTDNTLVVFFSDNGGSGPANNSPLRGHKTQMWEGGIRVPFIAKYPGQIPGGTVSHELLTSLELFPMFTKLAGGELPKDTLYDGFDMLPVLAGKEKSSRKEMFWQRQADMAARVGNYKWVDSKIGKGVFDLSTDISEKHDLSNERPELLSQLKGRFEVWRKEMDDAEPRGPFRDY